MTDGVYFHGGTPFLEPCMQVLPSNITGVISPCVWLYEHHYWPRSGSRDFVYVSQDISVAFLHAAFWSYADDRIRPGLGSVYEVTPGGEIHGVRRDDLWCSSASVVRVVVRSVSKQDAIRLTDARHRLVLDQMAKEFIDQ